QLDKKVKEKINEQSLVQNQTYNPYELIMGFEDTTSSATKANLANVLQTNSTTILDTQTELWELVDSIVIIGGNTLVGLNSIITHIGNTQPFVTFVEPNYEYDYQDLIPNDVDFIQQWGLRNTGQTNGTIDADIKATDAWDIFPSSSSIVIGLLDTGVDYLHPDLANHIWTNNNETPNDGIDNDNNGYVDDYHGYNFVFNNGNPIDNNGHGTSVAGIITAERDNNIGVAGVCDAKVMALKVFDANGKTRTSRIVRALNYAINMGVDITNNSWGGAIFSNAIYRAIQRTETAGQLFVAAAGNIAYDNDINGFYPAAYNVNNIITVGATDDNDLKTNFSNYGQTTVDLFAPGEAIYTTKLNSTYGNVNGTSFAAPFVTGALALMKTEFPTFTIHQLKNKLLAGVDTLANLQSYSVSSGRLDLAKSLDVTYSIVSLPNNVIVVDKDATGNNDGTSWADAYTDLQDALAAANFGDEIWVAEGTYYPTTTSNRNLSFELKQNVKLLGGFDGTEISKNQRDWNNYITVLSGDIGVLNTSSDNSYHVVRADFFADSTAILDGFIVRDGYGNSSSADDRKGGGITIIAGNPIIKNCSFIDNYAQDEGGAIFVDTDPNRNIRILGSKINNNSISSGEGGGISIKTCHNIILSNCELKHNTISGTGEGSVIYATLCNNVYLDSITVDSNSIGSTTTANGGICIEEAQDIFVFNTICNNNNARIGSGFYLHNCNDILFQNFVVNNNTSILYGAGVYIFGSNNIIITNLDCNDNLATHNGGVFYITT
ncbi:MAG: S8 family serine peptidase, partial [Saprospiraceae bacterium]